jgi:ribose transport system substrate-binding protein
VPELPDDPAQQSTLIGLALQARPDAVVLVPVHQTKVNAAIRRINDAGIPLVSTINRLGEGRSVCFVGSEDYPLAFDIASYLYERMGGHGSVAIIEGPPESVTSLARVRAFHDAAERFPGIRIVASCCGDYLPDPARKATAGMLAGAPDIDAILAANDIMAIGAIDALQAAGRTALLAGVNAIPEAIKAIKNGSMVATTDFNAMNMAYLATQCAIRHVRGEPVPAEIILPVQIVDRANCALWDLPYEARSCPDWKAVTTPRSA